MELQRLLSPSTKQNYSDKKVFSIPISPYKKKPEDGCFLSDPFADFEGWLSAALVLFALLVGEYGKLMSLPGRGKAFVVPYQKMYLELSTHSQSDHVASYLRTN